MAAVYRILAADSVTGMGEISSSPPGGIIVAAGG